MRFAILTAILLTLSACGGGGGGSGSSGSESPPPPAMSLSTHTLDVAVNVSAASAPPTSVTATVSNPPALKPVYVVATTTTLGVQQLGTTQTGDITTLSVTFRFPGGMKPGTYNDTITARACYDTACNSPLPIAAQTVAVTYTVNAATGPGMPQLILSVTSLQATAMSSALAPPSPQTINVSVSNATSLPEFTLKVSQTYNGIFLVNTDVGPNGQGQISVPFQPPNQLFPAAYTDTLTVKGCYDENCVNVIGDSTQTVTVVYTIPANVAGPEGYSILTFPLVANDLVWDPVNSVIYASTPSTAGTNGNSIVIVNPATGAILKSVYAGSEPYTLALSDDSQFLYVALEGTNTIQRFALPALTPDLTIQLGSSGSFGVSYAWDISVMPGASHTLAVALIHSGEPDGEGVVIYDDAVPRPVTTPPFASSGVDINGLAWGASASTLYGSGSLEYLAQQGGYVLNVTTNGVSQAVPGAASQFPTYGRMHYYNGLIYNDGGEVVNPTTGATVMTCSPTATGQGVYLSAAGIVDTTQQTVFQLTYNFTVGVGLEVNSFEAATCQRIANVGIGGITVNTYPVPRLIRWGTNGLAFLSNTGALVTITGPFVSP